MMSPRKESRSSARRMYRLKQNHRPMLVRYIKRKEKDCGELKGYIKSMKDRGEEITSYACIHIPPFTYARLNRYPNRKEVPEAYVAFGKIRL